MTKWAILEQFSYFQNVQQNITPFASDRNYTWQKWKVNIPGSVTTANLCFCSTSKNLIPCFCNISGLTRYALWLRKPAHVLKSSFQIFWHNFSYFFESSGAIEYHILESPKWRMFNALRFQSSIQGISSQTVVSTLPQGEGKTDISNILWH